MSEAEQLKAQANKAFSAKDYPEAIKLYSDAIALDPTNNVLYSNRSAAKSGAKDYQGALEDANKCIESNPDFSKGYLRKGAAYHGSRDYPQAVQAYEEGLNKDPNSEPLKRGMADVRRAMDAEMGPGGDMGLGKIFNDPGLMAKSQANPKTAEFMKDPNFVQKIQQLQANGGTADMQSSFGDPRMLTVLGVAMGVDIAAMERPEGSDEMPPGVSQPQSSSPPPPKPAPKKEEPPKKQEPQLDPEEAKAKKEADDLKAQGNAAYKQRKFDEAIPSYEKAWETYPKDIAYLTNSSAVYFEMGDYDKAIEVAQKAVDQAFELHADFKAVAKAYGRIGTSYAKKGDLDNAIKFYNKSSTEHRTPDVLTKLREAEKTKSENEKKAYIDPEKAEAAREEGNTAFKAGQYADAVKHYTEAIKRSPSDPRGYTNRSAAYTKSMALPEASKDANDAIKQDPDFVKAYIRKALVQNGMKENTSALETSQKAMDVDKEHKHQREIESNMNKIMNEIQAERANETDEQTYERAMRDPEVQEIMSDPVMRQILSDAQQNPRALMDHMKNPMVSHKIQKLINAGIIRTR